MKVLITGGPTWVKIDDVRILTNIFTGKTSLFLAKKFREKRIDVTLLINPHCIEKFPKNIKIIPFHYFEEFKKKFFKELKNNYRVIIHTAAVSDYYLRYPFRGKIPSRKKNLIIKLYPTLKLVKYIRRKAKKSFIIQFKLEAERKNLIEKAFDSLKENRTDLVVANALSDLKLGYKAFLIDKEKNITPVSSKKELFLNLYKIISNLR